MAVTSPSLPLSTTPPPGSGAVAVGLVSIDALADLRAATAAAHARLDSRLPLAQDHAGPAEYAQHVAVIGDWLADIDRLPVPVWPAGWAAAQHARHARIAADRADFGLSELHAPAELPDGPVTASFAWGVAYVVEGSQLGGQMLWRRLRAPLAPHALHYLQGDGVGGGWPRFTAALRAAISQPCDLDAARSGAQWAFAVLAARFERAGALA